MYEKMDSFANDMRARSISTGTYQSWEAARSGFFTLVVPDAISKFTRASLSKQGGKTLEYYKTDMGAGDVDDALRLNVLTADVPHFSLEVLQYKRGNDVVKFAGTPTFEAGSVKVDDVVGQHTKDILMAWQAKAYDVHTGKGGRMKDYKLDCTLYEYTQDFQQIRSWVLKGCWISALSEDAFDKENDGKRAITATIQYDRAYINEASVGLVEA